MRSMRLWCGASLALVLGLMAVMVDAGPAHAQTAPVIVYSYEKLVVGNDIQWVVVPRSGRMKLPQGAAPSPAIINGVFNELRSRKSATYGGTKIDVNARGMAKGTATVKVDSSKAAYFPIIAAEVVYSLAPYGITSVAFPGHSKKPLKRADIEFGVYTLRLPAWRALPPRNVGPAVVVMPSGKELASDAFYKLVTSGNDEAQGLLKKMLASSDTAQVQSAMGATKHLGFKGWRELIVPALKHPNADVRITALNLLDGSKGDAILDQVAAVMDKDKEARVAERAAAILGKSSNAKYAAMATYVQLRGKDEKAALAAIAKLVSLKEPTAAGELAKVARSGTDAVSKASMEALVSLKAANALVGLFQDAKLAAPRRLMAASLVQQLGANDATFKARTFLAENAPPAGATQALEQLAQTKTPSPRPAIEAALMHSDAGVRAKASELLVALKSPDSLKALGAAATKHPDQAEAFQDAAATIMGTLGVQEILQYSKAREPVLKRVAYQALGQKAGGAGSKAIFDVLARGIKSNDTGIQAASAKGLGPYKNDQALKLVTSVGGSKDAKVRRAVAQALGYWNTPAASDLLKKLMVDSEGDVVEAAVSSLTKRFEYDAYPSLIKLYRPNRHPHPGVRMAALKGLTVLAPEGNKRELQTVISILSGGLYDPEPKVKLQAIKLLGKYNNTAAVTGLASLINDPNVDYRVAAISALGATGSKEAVELVVSVLNDPVARVRMAAVEAIGALGHKEGSEALRKRIALEQDVNIKTAAAKALKRLK